MRIAGPRLWDLAGLSVGGCQNHKEPAGIVGERPESEMLIEGTGRIVLGIDDDDTDSHVIAGDQRRYVVRII